MTAADTSLYGYISIIVGFAFLSIGVAIYLSIRGTKQTSQSAAGSPPKKGGPSLSIPSARSEKAEESSRPTYMKSDSEQMAFTAAERMTDQNYQMGVGTVSLSNSDQFDARENKITPPSTSVEGAEYQHIATFYREEKTGRLLIRIGDRKFSSPSELFNSPHWPQIERLSSELSAWLRSAQEQRPPRPISPPEPPSAPKTAAAPQSMIGQINQILERKLAALGGEQRAVRLMEGPRGDVRVLVGVESYAINEVPYEEIRRLIREAVKEWEKS
jgi:hypothetical protein